MAIDTLPSLSFSHARSLVLGLVAITAVAVPAAAAADAPKPVRVLHDRPVTATNLINAPANNSPVMEADPRLPRFVALANRLDSPDFGCALQLSGDAGRTWVTADPIPKLPPGVEKCYAPEVAFDRKGVLYYLFVGLSGGGNHPVGAFLTTSSNQGRTWRTPRPLPGEGERYQVRMVIDRKRGSRGRLHLVWLESREPAPSGGFPASGNPIMSAFSDDGGRTFSKPVRVSDPSRPLSIAPVVAIGAHHRLHVLYYDLGQDEVDYRGLEGPVYQGTWSLVLTTSVDGGRSFDRGQVVDADIVAAARIMLVFTMPPASLAADGKGRVYVAWEDNRNGDRDVFLRSSTSNGKTWSDPVRVNDDRAGNGRDQYLPKVGVAPGGRVDVVFYDRRNGAQNGAAEVFYAYSSDHGARFRPNLLLTTVPFSPFIGPQYANVSARGQFEFGSRIALVSERRRALAAWADTRNTLRSPPAQDIYSTEVRFSSSGSAGP